MKFITYVAHSGPEDKSIYVDANTRIQILDTMLLLPNAEKEQCAAFIVRFFQICYNLKQLLLTFNIYK